MKKISILLMSVMALLITACQNNDIDQAAKVLAAPDAAQIQGAQNGDDYTWTWTAPNSGLQMRVILYSNGTFAGESTVSGSSYVHKDVPTNVNYEYVFKWTDGKNFSDGVVKKYTRKGASRITGVQMSQVEKQGGYDALVEWNTPEDATEVIVTATNGQRTISEKVPATVTMFLIKDVQSGDTWDVTVRATNGDGDALPTASQLRIGKTAIGFLSVYASPEELIANGDDDEASAWLWLHDNYASAKFVPFSTIKSVADIEPYRVLFWLRDLEGVGEGEVWNMPDDVQAATPFIQAWYKAGGNILLWSHATVYIGHLGRVSLDELKSNDRNINTGKGGLNEDTWRMAVQLNPGLRFKKDHSSHPIYKGLEVTDSWDGRTKLIAFKGPGFTEDHNCLFFNLPSLWTGLGNQDEACYTQLTQRFGVYPLGTWDSQIDWVSQFNVWEAQQGETDFKGTVLCIGNGGCEFSMKNRDGSPDKSAYPKNNIYQDNVLRLAKNSLEYLKTR